MADDNGLSSAFPTDIETHCETCQSSMQGVTPHPGLTKREYIAARAMQGMLAHPKTASEVYDAMAAESVKYADALLLALERTANSSDVG